MFSFSDLIGIGNQLWNKGIIPIFNFIISCIQFPFGIGTYGKYAPPFYLFVFFIMFVIAGYKLRFGFEPFIREMQNDFNRVNRKLAKKERMRRRKQ